MGENETVTLAGMNILLAEDNPTNQLVATQMLESLGAEVTLAVDGAEALEVLHSRSFDVALIDIEMPRVSGLDLIRRVRCGAGPATNIPMIALTAYVMREQRMAIEQAGADGIIAKPILSIEKFGQDILDFVEQHRGRPRPGALAAEPRPTPTGPEIDGAVFDRLWSSFDRAAGAELRARIVEDIGRTAASAAAAVRERDFVCLRASTHVLVSVAGIIGARKLESLAHRLNSAGHAEDQTSLDADGAELVEEAGRVVAFVGRG